MMPLQMRVSVLSAPLGLHAAEHGDVRRRVRQTAGGMFGFL